MAKDKEGHGSESQHEHHGRSNMDARSASDWSQEMSKLREHKPSPIHKMWNNPDLAPTERVAAHKETIKNWNSAYNKASKSQKAALERDNAAFHERNK